MMDYPPSFLSIVDGVRQLDGHVDVAPIIKKAPPDFHERQKAAQCGMHAMHNLLRNEYITKMDIDRVADKCAKESGDIVGNHKHVSGFWSIDTLVRCLQEYGYDVKQGVKTFGKTRREWSVGKTMYELLEDDATVGFLIHERFHYTALRKNKSSSGWEYSNSYNNAAHTITPYEFCKNALDGTWNIFLVTMCERVSL